MGLSNDAKDRLEFIFNIIKTTFHYGFMPFVLYLGFRKGPEPGMPPLTLLSLLWQ
ncbi:mitochondrial import receptor subunit TOM7 homolog [Teleopsis dalmanni]|uniref:mitochondrial import receptor subunit TOM7 homolog n=1 Tax=Teleopsis dalmanni TaxID=139649 RepID=UPI0018CF255D|nr:mitochondrial import receptor subunit TOM7 homolog [Teleopsis dalmanni]XP_037953375.1 mitochondrial import receptor subunit TOM7 homolog [Teleopsis dalmanni]